MIHRTCEECGTPLQGRSDKKFCSDQCRSTHNNRRNSEPNKFVRQVNNALRKNRRILDSLNAGGTIKVSAALLKDSGFDFRYFTSSRRAGEGRTCYYCYDQGYVPLGRNYFLLVLPSPADAPANS